MKKHSSNNNTPAAGPANSSRSSNKTIKTHQTKKGNRNTSNTKDTHAHSKLSSTDIAKMNKTALQAALKAKNDRLDQLEADAAKTEKDSNISGTACNLNKKLQELQDEELKTLQSTIRAQEGKRYSTALTNFSLQNNP